jgi:two-component system chemotaxis response regulator CheY
MRVLIVDDSPTMRRMIISSLHHIGFRDCVEASDGEEALRAFDSSIGCVITDWNMPNMSGLDFVRSLRAEHGSDVPIIMVTTRSVREDIVQAARAGVTNYIVKPFTPQVLKDKLDQVLGTVEGA